MTAKSRANGHKVSFKDGMWVYDDDGKVIGERPCANCCRETETVRVKIMADLSHTGMERWKFAMIDKCIAPLVKALQDGGVDMRASCCGHGKDDGEIFLADGRTLVIKRGEK